MSEVAKNWYVQYKKRYEENIHLWNTDQEKCSVEITGHKLEHNAWRMMKLDGAVKRMGGFANFSHYVNKCAETDYKIFDIQQRLIKKAIKKFKPETDVQKRIINEMKEALREIKELESK